MAARSYLLLGIVLVACGQDATGARADRDETAEQATELLKAR
jgi:hypothetical protein